MTGGNAPPVIGFGCGMRLQDPAIFEAAIAAGYRGFDTAVSYGNDTKILAGPLGMELRNHREELYLITKVQPHQDVAAEYRASVIGRMRAGYADLLLLHWPFDLATPGRDPVARFLECWREMEALLRKGAVRAIGLSNAGPGAMEFLLQHCEVQPAVNQVESHPYLPQEELVAWCAARNIRVQACCPLASAWRGTRLVEESAVQAIAYRLGRNPAQVCLRWHLQRGVMPIVSAAQPAHMKTNLQIVDFELDTADMAAINGLSRELRFINAPPHLVGLLGWVENGRLVMPSQFSGITANQSQ